MGGDGGTIISRRNCMRFNNKKKGKEISRDMERTHKWLHCALSQERLKKPIVGCRLGRLYNKDRLLEFLLDKSSRGTLKNMAHIRGLKDVKTVSLNENSESTGEPLKSECSTVPQVFPFCCPIMGMEMNGVYKFAFLWNCGCVMAEKAIRQLQISMCPNCDASFTSEDVVIVHAEGEDLQLMQSRLEDKLAQEASKKEKKRAASKMDPFSKESSDGQSVGVDKKKSKTSVKNGPLNTVEMKQSNSFKSLFHTNDSRQKLDPNRGFWSETTHSYFFKGT
ncbi:replication termination factor 2-like [Symsagittifera roscoffensis]|uniref:replication termination factor 2-like n=1 Tax=Symsagittifera roscoffensis TaxID=84072 RepID=UPI00307C9F83